MSNYVPGIISIIHLCEISDARCEKKVWLQSLSAKICIIFLNEIVRDQWFKIRLSVYD